MKELFNKKFLKKIINVAEPYLVGGCVRDYLMNKKSNDIDIVVFNILEEDLINLLKECGKVDLVGKSFGVIKFKPFDENNYYDISLPRIDERGLDFKHNSINVKIDYAISIEQELYRRDFTINSIAMDYEGNIIDPFGGVNDMKSGKIKWTNPEAFLDDPLRMLRAVRFAAVFGYDIDEETLQAIKKTRQRLLELPRERFRMEFEKMLKKQNSGQIISNALNLLKKTGTFDIVFNTSPVSNDFSKVTTMGELAFLIYGKKMNAVEKFNESLMPTNDEINDLIGFQMAQAKPMDVKNKRFLIFNLFKTSRRIFDSPYFPNDLKQVYQEMIQKGMPLTTKELAINGHDLMNLGYKGEEIGQKQRDLLDKIFSNELNNQHEELLTYLINGNKEKIQEMNDKKINKIAAYDFDGTLINSPLETYGKNEWQKQTGNPFPHIGWWGKKESLDTDIFNITPIIKVLNNYITDYNDPNTYTLILTNRIRKIEDAVINVLNNNNIPFNELNTKTGNWNKGQRLVNLLKRFPDVKTIDFYDDDMRHINDVLGEINSTGLSIQLNLFFVQNGIIKKVSF